jgi:hypothetical protein
MPTTAVRLLELVDRWVLSVHVVADLSCSHAPAHGSRRDGYGVGPQVDHRATDAVVRQLTAEVRSALGAATDSRIAGYPLIRLRGGDG